MVEFLQKWSLVMIAVGATLTRQGSQNDKVWLIGLGVALLVAGTILFLYKRLHNLGWIAAMIGGTLFLLGYGQNSSLFGNPIETPNSSFIIWGIVLALSGIGFWAFYRFGRKTQTS